MKSIAHPPVEGQTPQCSKPPRSSNAAELLAIAKQAIREWAAAAIPSWSQDERPYVIVQASTHKSNGHQAESASFVVHAAGNEHHETPVKLTTSESHEASRESYRKSQAKRRERFPLLDNDDCTDELSEICDNAECLADQIWRFRGTAESEQRHDRTDTAYILDAIHAACKLEWLIEGETQADLDRENSEREMLRANFPDLAGDVKSSPCPKCGGTDTATTPDGEVACAACIFGQDELPPVVVDGAV